MKEVLATMKNLSVIQIKIELKKSFGLILKYKAFTLTYSEFVLSRDDFFQSVGEKARTFFSFEDFKESNRSQKTLKTIFFLNVISSVWRLWSLLCRDSLELAVRFFF